MLDIAAHSAPHHMTLPRTNGWLSSPGHANRRARRAAARRRRFAPALCGVVLAASSSLLIQPVRAQQTTQTIDAGGDSLKVVNLPLDRNLQLPFPPRSTYSIDTGGDFLKARALTDNTGAQILRLEPQRVGRALVTISSPNGPPVSYLIYVGREGAVRAQADAPGAKSPVVASPSISLPPSLPTLDNPPRPAQSTAGGGSLPSGMAPLRPVTSEPEISQIVPSPAPLPPGRRPFPLPTRVQSQIAARTKAPRSGRNIPVPQGLARIMEFRANVLTVFFSNPTVMDARVINARNVAITGTTAGRSTLAVFVAQSPTDVVGRAEIWNIIVEPTAQRSAPDPNLNASSIEVAIRSALSDPRIAVRAIAKPDGSFAATLSGALHDAAEIKAAVDTAALFVARDQVISSLYTDQFAPSLAQALYPATPVTNEQVYQAKLRQITGNNSIELISLPTGLAVKAEVDSPADAEALLNLLPTLNQRVLPFIVVRGQNGNGGNGDTAQSTAEGGEGKYYGAQRPILTGEDQEMTRKMHEVTGVRTVYAVRTAINALAVYGTARDRTEYETVRRYLLLLPLLGAQATPLAGGNPPLRGGYSAPLLGAGNANNGAGNVANGALMSPQLNSNAQLVPGNGIDGSGGLPNLTPIPGTGGFVNTPSTVIGVPQNTSSGPLTSDLAGTSQSFLNSQAPGFITNPETLLSPFNAAAQPNGGYRQSINLQMFVRILDPNGQTVRRVTAETSIVEISRNALRNIGVQAGSAALLTENITQTPATIVPGVPGTNGQGSIPPVVFPGTQQRTVTIDPTFRGGVLGLGQSVSGAFRNLDPLRLRLDALYQRGNARLLSQPNISALEGTEAQIVIGGERPVPGAVTTGQAVGQTITFRRFGIILTMRPTVTDDDTIILQIRADVTSLAPEFGTTINGTPIPGESTRSVDTVLNVREGDTIVLGGLISNERREQTSRIPILSSIPILGKLFRSRRFENNESELAIFITPRIFRDGASVNTKEAIQRAAALPPLRGNQSATGVFGLGGAGQGQ